ncbi:MAG TPA: phosphate ABC transporter substrate-binding protein PstS, partial [Nocardioides sp.]|nr:phosphate ABC transporter substrate-binding protein PstS [Nocardioides sp.]
MNRRFLQWLVAPAVVAGLATMGLVAGTAGAGATVADAKLKSATLNGSGSTFQQAYDQAAIQEFTAKNSGITINYAGGGSGKGRQDFADQVVDFAGTDAAYPAADLAKVKGGDFFYIPTVVAPITISYNLPDVKNLQLSASTIAKIFQRNITKWNDPAIAADNPKATLPSTNITVAHRSDSSGTTNNFTVFLTKAAPSDWKLGASSTINWPSDTQAGNGNPGVANIVKTTEGAIGYVDYSDARATGLTFAAVKNQSLKYVKPSVKSASVAAATAAIPENLLYDPIFAPGAGAYPITSPTWIL